MSVSRIEEQRADTVLLRGLWPLPFWDGFPGSSNISTKSLRERSARLRSRQSARRNVGSGRSPWGLVREPFEPSLAFVSKRFTIDKPSGLSSKTSATLKRSQDIVAFWQTTSRMMQWAAQLSEVFCTAMSAGSEPDQTRAPAPDFRDALPRVHDQAAAACHSAVVKLGVVGENEHAVRPAELLLGGVHGLEVGAVHREGGHVGVGIGD